MFRTALRNVLAHKARLLMTVLAVMLGVAFVSGTLVFTNTISDAYQNSSAKGFDQVDVAVQAKSQEDEGNTISKTPELTQALLDRSAKVPGAASAIGVVNGFTAIADKDGKLIGGGFQSQGGNYWGTKDPRYPLTSGSAPHGRNQVAIDSQTAHRAGYKVGDTVRLSVDGPVLTPTITGIFTTDDGNVAAGGSLALYDTATAQELFGKAGTYDEIDVKAASGTSQTALKAGLDKALRDEAGGDHHRQAARRRPGRADLRVDERAEAGPAGLRGYRALRRHVHHRQHLHHAGRPAHQGAGAAAGGRRLPPPGHPVRADRGVRGRRDRRA